jgi:hypothetical protein
MRRIGLYFLILTTLSLNFIPPSRAQGKPAGKVQVIGFGPDVPNAGLRAEFLEEVAYYEQRYTRLAEAMPAESTAGDRARGSAPSAKFLPTSPSRITVSRTL